MSRAFNFSVGEYYHVFNRGVEKRTIFNNLRDKERFQKLLYLCNGTKVVHLSVLGNLVESEALYSVDRGEPLVAVGAYCLLNSHFHLLMKEHKSGGISRFMQKLSTAYTMYFNIRNQRTGSLFENRFRAKHAKSNEYLKYLFAYIHLNPVQHIEPNWKEEGIKNFEKVWRYTTQYPFSSLPDYLGANRSNKSILSITEFPSYFRDKGSMSLELQDWLTLKLAETDY